MLFDYYRNELDLINLHLGKVGYGFPMDDIHKVRVGIKKLKAFHRMMAFTYPDQFSAKVLNRSYKMVFRSFGKFREKMICIRLFKRYSGSSGLKRKYREYLMSDMAVIQEEIVTLTGDFTRNQNSGIQKDMFDMLSGIYLTEEIGMIESFIENQRLKAVDLFEKSSGYEKLHSIRILLKNIKPFLKMLSVREESKFLKMDYKLLNRTETLIGNWHDREILERSVQVFISGYSLPEKLIRRGDRAISRMKTRDIKELNRIRTKIRRCLDVLS